MMILIAALTLTIGQERTFKRPDIHCESRPYRVYRDVVPGEKKYSITFDLLMVGFLDRHLVPYSSDLLFYVGDACVKELKLGEMDINRILGNRYTPSPKLDKAAQVGLAGQSEVFDLRHHILFSTADPVDRIEYTLLVKDDKGAVFQTGMPIPVLEYKQETKMCFPLTGHWRIAERHPALNGLGEWSQEDSLQIEALGPNGSLYRGDGKRNADYFGWGTNVYAPAGGVVAYARNDVPDQTPGQPNRQLYETLPEPLWAILGNVVEIDDGNGEYTVLGHLRQGSVVVRTGDSVSQGCVLGLMGNSGKASYPHLHFHAMAGPLLFNSDPLPVQFERSPSGGEH